MTLLSLLILVVDPKKPKKCIEVTVSGVKGDQVRIGVQAPRETAVHRKEIYTQIQEENKAIKSIPPQNA